MHVIKLFNMRSYYEIIPWKYYTVSRLIILIIMVFLTVNLYFHFMSKDYIKCFKCLKSIPKAYITAHSPLCTKQVVLFSCKFCDFQTKTDNNLINHALRRHAVFIDLNKCYVRLFKAFGILGNENIIQFLQI